MNGSQTTSRKGFRDVKTLQTLANAAEPRQRHQLASKFARLENERARLERELDMWETRRHSVERKLTALHDEIEALRLLLLTGSAGNSGHRPARNRPVPQSPSATSAPVKQRNTAIALEY